MSAEAQSGFASFEPRARLLKLIGAELISDDVVAITELVKNAFDADASLVTIRFRSTDGGEILVEDDGMGMDRDALLGGWMSPAGSTKRDRNARVTAKGRRVLGEKGLGRFAADKLGSKLELISHRLGTGAEVVAVFDWDAFDNDLQSLQEVQSRWEIRPAPKPDTQGTVLRITGLRTKWTERMFRRLSTRLARLRSPFREKADFSIRIESDVFPEYSGELVTNFLERAPYSIDARFDGEETVTMKLGAEPVRSEMWLGPGHLSCGAVRVRLYAFDLETEAVARIGPRMEVRAWLKDWSGVSVYRDGFRLWPYGEPHDDWLRLDQRRVNNPVLRLSNNQVVGFVEIAQDSNGDLKDQTNREGMVNNVALEDLRKLLNFVFESVEAHRQSIRHRVERKKARDRVAVVAAGEPVAERLDSLAAEAPREMASELRRLSALVRATQKAQSETKRYLVATYTELGALGYASLGLAGGMRTSLGGLQRGLEEVRGVLGGVTEASAALLTLEDSMALLSANLDVLATVEGDISGGRRAIDVVAELERFAQNTRRIMAAHRVEFELAMPRNGVLRIDMRPPAFHRLMHLLVGHSLERIRERRTRLVRVTAAMRDDLCVLDVTDSGVALAHDSSDLDVEVMTGRTSPGLRLALARSMVEQHGGSMRLIVGDRRRRGATVRLTVPRKRSRSTVR